MQFVPEGFSYAEGHCCLLTIASGTACIEHSFIPKSGQGVETCFFSMEASLQVQCLVFLLFLLKGLLF